MKELVIISGKGGTGKTSLTACFAALSQDKVLCDADVDAADLHLLLQPEIRQETDFTGGNTALIAMDRCTQCGLCVDMCRFNAISDEFVVNPIDCEGCGVCVDFCPEQAIDFPLNTCGQWYVSDTRMGPMVHARLGIAEENSGKLVTLGGLSCNRLHRRCQHCADRHRTHGFGPARHGSGRPVGGPFQGAGDGVRQQI